MSTICKYRHCGAVVEQRPGGRRREYCDDACRQAEHRARQGDAAKQAALQEVASWGHFQPASIEQLVWYLTSGSRDTARKLADLLLAEQQTEAPTRGDLAQCEREDHSAVEWKEHYTVLVEAFNRLSVQASTKLREQAHMIQDLETHNADLSAQLATWIERDQAIHPEEVEVQAQLPALVEQENARLKQELAQAVTQDLQHAINTASRRACEWQEKYVKQTEALAYAQSVIQAREETIKELANAPHLSCAVENSALKQSLTTSQEEWTRANKEIERLKEQLDRERHSSAQQIGAMARERAQLQKALEDQSRKKLQARIRELEDQGAQATLEIARLKALVDSQSHRKLRQKIAELEQQVTEAQNQAEQYAHVAEKALAELHDMDRELAGRSSSSPGAV